MLSENQSILAWLGVGLLGGLLLRLSFPVLYPLYPDDWTVPRSYAEIVATDLLGDLGVDVDKSVSRTRLEASPALERSLLERLSADPAARFTPEFADLRDSTLFWRVEIFDPSATDGRWRGRASLSPGGRILDLEKAGDGPDPAGPSDIFVGEARLEAEQFLRESGVDVAAFEEPEVWRQEPGEDVLYTLRYRRRADAGRSAGADAGSAHGVEVRFRSGELLGMRRWLQSDGEVSGDGDAARSLRGLAVLSTLRVFLVIPLLGVALEGALKAPPLRGRLHRLALGTSAFVLLAGGIVVLTSTQSLSGDRITGLSSRGLPVSWSAVLLFAYLPLHAALVYFALRAGRPFHGDGGGGAFELHSILSLRWSRPEVGWASLRGSAAGLFAAGLGLLGALGLDRGTEVWAPLSLVAAPWWQQSLWPGPGQALWQIAVSSGVLFVGLYFLLPRFDRWIGPWPGAAVVTVVLAVALGPSVEVVPVGVAFPLALGAAAAPVLVFRRFGLLAGWVCGLVLRLVPAALPLLFAEDASLQAQGWLAVALAMAPLVATVGSIGRHP